VFKLFDKIKAMLPKKPDAKRSMVIVEIGNDWLKVAQKDHSQSAKAIKKISLTKLADIKDNVSIVLEHIFKDLHIGKEPVIMYIPRHLVTARNLELPSTDPKEIDDMINLQIGKQTPYSKEEIISGYKINPSSREGYAKVLLVIVQRSLVTERVDTLRKAGIAIKTVAVSSEGVYNWFNNAYASQLDLAKMEEELLLDLDIDSNYSDLIAVSKDCLAFTKSIFIGANHLMDDPPPGGWRDKFIEELTRSLERYQSDERGVKIKKMFLSGAARNIKDLDSALSAKLGIPVEYTDPTKGVEGKCDRSVIDSQSSNHVSITPLVGMALSGKDPSIDLTPLELRIKKIVDAKRQELMVTGVLIAAIITMASLLVLVRIQVKNTYRASLKSAIARVESDSIKVEKMRSAVDLIRSRMDTKDSCITVLAELYRITPREIYFTNVDIDEGRRLVLRGRGGKMSDVFKYVTTLENSVLFENVKTTYTTTKKEDETEYAEFEIVCSFQKG